MGILISIIIALFVGIVLVIYGMREYSDEASILGWVLTIVCGIVVAIMLICASTLPADFEYIEEKYNNLKAQLEEVDRDDIVTGENLRNQALDMNNQISKHRCYSKNMWVSMWYSERIGNLEPLKWKSTKEKARQHE